MNPDVPPLDDANARGLARDLLSSAPEELFVVEGIDLGPALEQAVFATVRGPMPRPRSSAVTAARVAGALLGGVLPGHRIGLCDLLVVLLNAVHRQVFDPVRSALAEVAPHARVGYVRAARATADPRLASVPRADRHLRPGRLPALASVARHRSETERRLRSAWTPHLGSPYAATLAAHASDAFMRLAIEALRLDAVLDSARPRVVIAYDEINAYARLLPVIARRHGAVSLDLPHAEAANRHAIAGAAYDWMAVFGHRAAEVLVASGVPRDRIVEVGAARFDALQRGAGRREPDSPPRVVMAAQYATGAMTSGVRARIMEIAVAAAAAVQPAVVQVRPHPVESPREWHRIASTLHAPGGVEVRIEDAELHDLLPGAFALVTGWSNSVFEAVIAGVPAITAHVTSGAPAAAFAAEGIALQAASDQEAADVARRLTDTHARDELVSRAREQLEPHLGPLDGHAAERTAALVNGLLGLAPGSGSPRV